MKRFYWIFSTRLESNLIPKALLTLRYGSRWRGCSGYKHYSFRIRVFHSPQANIAIKLAYTQMLCVWKGRGREHRMKLFFMQIICLIDFTLFGAFQKSHFYRFAYKSLMFSNGTEELLFIFCRFALAWRKVTSWWIYECAFQFVNDWKWNFMCGRRGILGAALSFIR